MDQLYIGTGKVGPRLYLCVLMDIESEKRKIVRYENIRKARVYWSCFVHFSKSAGLLTAKISEKRRSQFPSIITSITPNTGDKLEVLGRDGMI